MKHSTKPSLRALPGALLVLFTLATSYLTAEATVLRPNQRRVGLLRAHAYGRSGKALVKNASDWEEQMTAAVDKLGGILDAVSGSFATTREALTSFDSVCTTQASDSGARVRAGSAALSTLGDTKLRETSNEARLAAQISGLKTEEEKAKANFDSTVERRALESKEYLDFKETNDKQAAVIDEVIKKLEAKKLEMGEATNSSNHQSDPGSGGAQLDYVIGVFSSLKDSTQKEGTEQAEEVKSTDSQLLSLVSSYKEALQHTDAQYQTKETERVAAEVAVLRASEEITLRNDIESKETTLGEKLTDLCALKSGKVPALISSGDQRISDLDTHINLALTTLSELGFGAALLQKARRAVPRVGAGKQHATAATLARRQAANSAAGLPAAALAAAEKIVPQVKLAILHADPDEAATLSTDQEQCVSEKKRLTAEIITARQAAQQARTAEAQAQGRVDSRSDLIKIVSEEKTAMDATKTALSDSWTPVTTSVSGGTEAFDAVVADAQTELAGVQEEVAGYAAEADAPPKAQALKVAVEACVKSLTEVQEIGTVDVPAASTAETEAQITLSAISEQLGTKATALQDAQAPDEQEVTTQKANAESFESQEQELMQQRTTEEERCETILAGTSEGSSSGNLVLAVKGKLVVSKKQEAEAWALAKKWLGPAFPSSK